MTMTTQLLTCPTPLCSFPRVQIFRRTSLQWATFSPADGDPVQNVNSHLPIPIQTGANPWQLQHHATYPQSVPAVLGLEEAVRLLTQRAREALHDQRETARRALLHQQGEFLAATHQHERLRGQILYVLWQDIMMRTIRMCEYNFDSSNKKQMRDVLEDRKELLSRYSQEASQAPEDQREILVMEVTSKLWDSRTDMSLHALHSEDFTQQQSQ